VAIKDVEGASFVIFAPVLWLAIVYLHCFSLIEWFGQVYQWLNGIQSRVLAASYPRNPIRVDWNSSNP